MTKKIGIIDINSGPGSFSNQAISGEGNHFKILLAIEGNAVASSLYELKHPNVPILHLDLAPTDIIPIESAIKKVCTENSKEYDIHIQYNSKLSLYHRPSEQCKDEVKSEVNKLLWLVFFVDNLLSRKMIHSWVFALHHTMYKELTKVSYVILPKHYVLQSNYLSYGIQQDHTFSLMSSYTKIEHHPFIDPREGTKWYTHCNIREDQEVLMILPSYTVENIISMHESGSLYKLPHRTKNEIPYTFSPTKRVYLVKPDATAVVWRVPSDSVGKILGFDDKFLTGYIDTEQIKLYSDERLRFYCESLPPAICNAILTDILSL